MSKFRFGSLAAAMSAAMSAAKYGPLDWLIHWIRNNNIKKQNYAHYIFFDTDMLY